MRNRDGIRNAAEPRSDRLDLQPKRRGYHRGQHDGNQKAGQLGRKRLSSRMTAMVKTATAVAGALIVPI